MKRLLFVLLAAGIVLLSTHLLFENLGASSLHGDEAIHAEIAAEMVASGQWFPPTSLGHPYLHKPPLKIWAVAWIFEHFGVNERNARLLDAMSGVILMLVVFAFGARVWNVGVGAVGALLLLGARQLVFAHGLRAGAQDAGLVLLVTASLFLYFLHLDARRARPSRLTGAAVCAACAVLVKGPVALVFVAPTVILFEISVGRSGGGEASLRASVRDGAIVIGSALAIYAIWFAALWHAVGARLEHATFANLVLRNTVGVDPRHLEGWWFYPSSLTKDFGLWLLALVPAVAGWLREEDEGDRHAGLFLGLWVLVGFLLPSLSVSKRPWYLYPIYPALALVLARGIDELRRRLSGRPAVGLIVALALLAGLVVRLERIEDLAVNDVKVSPVARFARYVEAHPGIRLTVRKRTQLTAWEQLYLGPLAERVRGNAVLDEPAGCRVLLQTGTAAPAGAPTPLRMIALRNEPGEEVLYAVDLDRCLPPWL